MQHLKNIIQGLKDFWYAQVWVLEGHEAHSKKPCTVLYAGSEVHKNYIAHLVFKTDAAETYLGMRNPFALSQLIKGQKSSYDMVVIEGLKLHRKFYEAKNDFFIPLWLKAKVKIPLEAKNRSTKDDMRRLRKYQLNYRIAESEEDYQHFYQKMYLPTMAQRHDDRTIAMAYDAMLHQLQHNAATLLLITMEDQTIAGTVMRKGDTMPVLWSTGILDGNQDYWKTGVTSACYLYCAQYATDQGHTEMDMGLSRAFLSDGVLQYKKKWNAQFRVQGQRGFILKIQSCSDAVKQFLQQHPFAHLKDHTLYGALFLDHENTAKDHLEKLKTKYELTQFKAFKVFHLSEEGPSQLHQ